MHTPEGQNSTHPLSTMKWQDIIKLRRQKSAEEKRAIRLRNIPRKVANSMPSEGQSVDQRTLEIELEKLLARTADTDFSSSPVVHRNP